MSVQLVVYHQNYVGYSAVATPVLNEYVGNSYFLTVPPVMNICIAQFANWANLLLASQGVPLNTWKGYYTCSSVGSAWIATNPPIINAGLNPLMLQSTFGASGNSYCGVMQALTNLTQGAQYHLNITHSGGSGAIQIGGLGMTNTIGQGASFNPITAGTYIFPFTAPGGANILMITLINNVGSTFLIQEISVTENPSTVPVDYTDLSDGQVILDLYNDEEIPLTLSVDDFTNAAEKPQSYSKDFDLPNTKHNNKILKHIFDITKVYQSFFDFNIYAKTRAIVKQDGVDIFQGYMKIIEIVEKEGVVSYNVNLFSETVSLVDSLRDRKFENLDFSELDHTYNRNNILSSWDDATGLALSNTITSDSFAYDGSLASPSDHTNVLKYPFVDWTGSVPLANGTSGNASTFGYPEIGQLQQVFRPFIQLKYIIDKIFAATEFEYSSAFFDTAHFKKLFMDFNWGSDNGPSTASGTMFEGRGTTEHNVIISDSVYTPFELEDAAAVSVGANYNTSVQAPFGWDITENNTWFMVSLFWCRYNRYAGVGTTEIRFRWVVRNSSTGAYINTVPGTYKVQNIGAIGGAAFAGAFGYVVNAGETIGPEAIVDDFEEIQQLQSSYPTSYGSVKGNIGGSDMNQTTLLQTLRGDIGQFDFLKGLMTMFNLVTMPDPDSPKNIIIEPYPDIFGFNPTAISGKQIKRDWTYKIDANTIKMKPLDLKKSVVFKFEEDADDFMAEYFRVANMTPSFNGQFGSKDLDTDNMLLMNGNMVALVEGVEEIIATPFASTICRPFRMDQLPEFIVPSIYSAEDGGTYSEFDNAPRILYNNGIVDLEPPATYYIPSAFGIDSTNYDKFLQFSHMSNLPSGSSDEDYFFANTGGYGYLNGTVNNLYNNYYAEYFNHLYDPNTRVITVKVDLNSADINTFQFYDIIVFKNREYRVNKINYKPKGLSDVELILLN